MMGRRYRLGSTLLAGVVAAALVACGSPSDGAPGQTQIAYASDNEATALVAAVTRGMQAAADAAGVELSVSDNAQDSAKIVNFARQAATTKPSVFVEYNSVADANASVARILKEAGVPVLAVQYAIEGAPLFAIDNTQVGRLGGQALADAARQKWGAGADVHALLLALPQGGQPQLERRDGAAGALRDALGTVDITASDTRQDPNTARQVTTDYLSAHPDGHVVIWSHVDSMASAAVAAARAAGREGDVLVAGTGGDQAIFPELRRPNTPLVGTVGLFPEDWGAQIVDLATKIAQGQQVPDVTHPARIEMLTPANIDTIYPA
jgi:ribose transport system substrate-binding protein